MPSFADLDPELLGGIVELAVSEAANEASQAYSPVTDRSKLGAAISRTSWAFVEPGRRSMLRHIDIEFNGGSSGGIKDVEPGKLLAFLEAREGAAAHICSLRTSAIIAPPTTHTTPLRRVLALVECTVQSLTFTGDETALAATLPQPRADDQEPCALRHLAVRCEQLEMEVEFDEADADLFISGPTRSAKCEATVARSVGVLLRRHASWLEKLAFEVVPAIKGAHLPIFAPAIEVPKSMPRLASLTTAGVEDQVTEALIGAAGKALRHLGARLTDVVVSAVPDQVSISLQTLRGYSNNDYPISRLGPTVTLGRFTALREVHLPDGSFEQLYATLSPSMVKLVAVIPTMSVPDANALLLDVSQRLLANWLPRLSYLQLTYALDATLIEPRAGFEALRDSAKTRQPRLKFCVFVEGD